MNTYSSTTIILPVIDETTSLKLTVETILNECNKEDIAFIFAVSQRTSPHSLAICQNFVDQHPKTSEIHLQKLPFLGGAIRECFEKVQTSHVIMMASDLETDPSTVKTLIAQSKLAPSAVITATRWRQGGSFQGYNPIKLILNYIFQKLFSLLYRCNLSDMTFGFRIFPTQLVNSIQWEELRHPFLLETLIKPLRLGVPIVEVPTSWKARMEGESHNPFIQNFKYFPIALKVLMTPRNRIMKHHKDKKE